MMLESKGDLVAGSGSAAQVLAPTRDVAKHALDTLGVRMSDVEALWSVRMREEVIVIRISEQLENCGKVLNFEASASSIPKMN